MRHPPIISDSVQIATVGLEHVYTPLPKQNLNVRPCPQQAPNQQVGTIKTIIIHAKTKPIETLNGFSPSFKNEILSRDDYRHVKIFWS